MDSVSGKSIQSLCDEEIIYAQNAIKGIKNTLDTFFLLKKDIAGEFMRKEIEKFKLHYFYYLKMKQVRLGEGYIDAELQTLSLLAKCIDKIIIAQQELIDIFDVRMFKTEPEKKLESLQEDLEKYKAQRAFLTEAFDTASKTVEQKEPTVLSYSLP